ncbi:hypothetical protein HY968_04675 [Candidatus Kaiserbacteria bacterium]|nr:hypothetical protein [Candidatus Kaiserbacteria bacterium]
MNKSDLNQIKEVIDSALESHLASVHEEIEDVREELKGDIQGVRTELKKEINDVRDDLKADIKGNANRMGAMDNRIDDESAARRNLESRIRKVLPKLPAAPERV